MKNKFIFILVFTSAFLITFATISCKRSGNKSANPEWETAKIIRTDIGKSVLATGIIKPQVGAEVRIGSRVSGTVTDLLVNIGDYVKSGQLLAVLYDGELKAMRDKAFANLKNAKANLKYADIELQRTINLKQKEFVSEQVLDNAEKQYELANAQIMLCQADLNYANIQLGFSNIYASISGVISSVSTQKGETVSATITSPTFVTIIDLERLEIWAYVDETDIGRIEVGQNAKFTVDTYTDTEFTGKVTAIYPQAEIQNNVVNYIVIIKMDRFDEKILRPEMTASVTVYIEKHENVMAIINKALKRSNNNYYVYVLENDQPIKRKVKIGIYGKTYTEIIDGLKENELIVLNK